MKAFVKVLTMHERAGAVLPARFSLISKRNVAYVVKITDRAERDLDLLYEALYAGEHEAALNWYHGLKAAISSLEKNPLRCPVTPED